VLKHEVMKFLIAKQRSKRIKELKYIKILENSY